MKMKKNWTGKKEITNPVRKEQHEIRKYKLCYLRELEEHEHQQAIKEYNANKQIQK